MKKNFIPTLVLMLFSVACALRLGWPNRVTDTPAPTSIPLDPTSPAMNGPNTNPADTALPEKPINLPPGFAIGVFASGLAGPRMLANGPDGQLYVAERGAGRVVRLPDADQDGQADRVEALAEGLDEPSSLAFHPDGSLYVAETTRVWRLSNADPQGIYQDRQLVMDGLPGGGHSTRTLLFSADGSALFVSIGSSCNVCQEADERRAAILHFNPDGSGGRLYASGLRNAVGITFRPGTDELWATNNGRDFLGDDQPPETVYQVIEGEDYGWPGCHAGRIVDPDHGSDGSCEGVPAPLVEMQAHSAPLGLGFYTGSQFPAEYQGDLFIALHGSWNRSTPVGYKVVRVSMEGGAAGPAEDFAVGWLEENGSAWGRPVDVTTGSDGSLFVSDDGGGFIYRIFYAAQ